jgi:hypothetical protein
MTAPEVPKNGRFRDTLALLSRAKATAMIDCLNNRVHNRSTDEL